MNNSKLKRLRQQIIKFRQQFAQNTQKLLNQVLPEKEIEKVIVSEAGAYRDRTYPLLTTLGLFVGQVLSPDHACQDVVGRRLSERVAAGEAQCSLNTGPYCKARQRMPIGIPQKLLELLGLQLEDKSPKAWRWRGRTVKLFDGTTVSMPDTPSNQSAFPQSSEQKPGLGFPVARVGALIGLASGSVLGYVVAACEGKGTGEQSLFRQLYCFIKPGDIILADALHTTWWTIAALLNLGADIVMHQHGCRKTDFSTGKRLGKRDHLVEWSRPQRPKWMDEASYRALPEFLLVRETEVAGRVLVTTMHDAENISPAALDALYGMRWNIEVDFRTIKVTMEMDVLRCKSKEMVEKEIAVYLLAYNLVRWAMASAASCANVLPRALGFTGTKRILEAFREQLRHCSGKRITVMIGVVLGAIAMLKLPYRPDRVEPRAKKRRPKNLPILTVPRQLARQFIIDQRVLKVVP